MNSVILEINDCSIAAGFSGNSSAVVDKLLSRALWNSAATPGGNYDLDSISYELKLAIKRVFSNDLLLGLKNERIVIVEPGLSIPLKQILSRLVLQGLQAASVAYVPRYICSLIGAGVRDGLVIDIGWSESTVAIIGDLREMAKATTTRGVRWAFAQYRKKSDREPPDTKPQGDQQGSQEEKDHDSQLDDLRLYSDTKANLDLDLTDVLFDEDKYNDEEEQSVLQLTAKLLNTIDTDTRALILRNIVIESTAHCDISVDTKKSLIAKLGFKHALLIKTLGSWTGGSLYISSVPWGVEKMKVPGEVTREDRSSIVRPND